MNTKYVSEKPGPTIGPNEIGKIEDVFGFKLPKDYNDFLLATNGGLPTESACVFKYLHPIRRVMDENTCITEWCSIGGELDLYNAVNYNRTLLEKNLVPIGQVTGGHLLCINVGQDNNSAVCLMIDEYIITIAGTFRQFYDELLPYTVFEN